MYPENINPLVVISFVVTLVGLSVILGIWLGFVFRDKAIVTGDVKKTLMLPSGWLVHMISQDIATGLWTITAASILETDAQDLNLVAYHVDARNIIEAFNGITANIRNKKYMDICLDKAETKKK